MLKPYHDAKWLLSFSLQTKSYNYAATANTDTWLLQEEVASCIETTLELKAKVCVVHVM